MEPRYSFWHFTCAMGDARREGSMKAMAASVPGVRRRHRCESKRRVFRLCALTTICGFLAAAQSGGITMRQLPGRAIVTDPAGNVYAAGNPDGSGVTPTPGAAQPVLGGGFCDTISV